MTDKTICPLCLAGNSILVKDYPVSKLASGWQEGFGFNPFEKLSDRTTLSKLSCSCCGLLYYEPALVGDESLYRRLMKFSWYHEENKWEFTEALKTVNEQRPGRLLEIGCANGNFLLQVPAFVGYIEGTELNKEQVKICLGRNLNVSEKKLEEIDTGFDMILLFQVLEHLNDLHEKMNKLMSLLNDSGILIISVPNPDSYLKSIDLPLLDLPPHHFSGWPEKTFDYLTRKYPLRKIHYACEPMRFKHFAYFRKEKIMKRLRNPYQSRENLTGKIINAGKRRLYELLSYPLFLLHMNSMKGQSHLVVLKKTAETER